MQGREFYRDAGALVDAAPVRGAADGVHGALVFSEIARRVLGGRRRLAQHVVGEREAARLAFMGGVDRLVDGAAGDELLAHQAHGDVDALADDRLAAARDEPGQRGAQRLLAGRRHEPPGQHEAPGRGVDEQRRARSRHGPASRRATACRGSARPGWRRRECATAPRRGTSAPRLPGWRANIRRSAPRRRSTAFSRATSSPGCSPKPRPSRPDRAAAPRG